jgi:hypothetical protein
MLEQGQARDSMSIPNSRKAHLCTLLNYYGCSCRGEKNAFIQQIHDFAEGGIA